MQMMSGQTVDKIIKMKKIVSILILFISLKSFTQLRYDVRVPGSKYMGYMMKNAAGDSIIFYIGSSRFAILDSTGVAPTTYTFSTGLTNTANTITNNLLTGVSGGQTIIGSTSTNSGLSLKATTSVTAGAGADINFLVRNNGDVDAGRINYLGKWGINNTAPGAAGSSSNFLNINVPTTTDALAEVMLGLNALGNKGLVIQAKASQTGNLFETQSSGGTIMTNISAAGSLGIGVSNTTTHAILINRSDLTGGGAAAPSIKVSNTSASSPGGGQYNYGMMQVLAGNEAVAGQFFANYGTGATAPFNFGSGVIIRSVGAFPIVFAPNSVATWQINSSGHLLATDNTYDIGASGATRPRNLYAGTLIRSPKFETAASVQWTSGTGSPESVVTANIGSLYTRTDGGANTTLYVKESGAGNTGWIAK